MSRFTWVAVLACTAAFGLAACGGGDDSGESSSGSSVDVQAIRDLGDSLAIALKEERYGKLCDRLDPAAMLKQFGSVARCVKTVGRLAATTDTLPGFDYDKIDVEGNTAVGTDSTGTQSYFKRIDGRWYIDPSGAPASDSSQGD